MKGCQPQAVPGLPGAGRLPWSSCANASQLFPLKYHTLSMAGTEVQLLNLPNALGEGIYRQG